MMTIKRAGWCDLGNHPIAPGGRFEFYRAVERLTPHTVIFPIKSACPECFELDQRRRAVHNERGQTSGQPLMNRIEP